MVRIRFTRALIVSAVIASLLILPVAAQAAPREDTRDGGTGISLLGSLVDWVQSIWGAGGSDLDPTGKKLTASSPAPIEGGPAEGELQVPSMSPGDP